MYGAERVFEEPSMDLRTARDNCDETTFALTREFINKPTGNQERWLMSCCRAVAERLKRAMSRT